ncbi:MAG: rRNA maturation RNase YbeY [Bacteroidales bacterium]|nr:rRNA maturation RNase YbeY [Bacteroidales bacterium]
MKIYIEYLANTDKKIALKLLKKWIEHIIRSENWNPGKLLVIITTDYHLKEINNCYLKHNYFTDVITFADNRKNIANGEIYISYDRVKMNAEKYKVTIQEELLRVILHGVLHMVGYEDNTDVVRIMMRKREEHYLKMRKKLI